MKHMQPLPRALICPRDSDSSCDYETNELHDLTFLGVMLFCISSEVSGSEAVVITLLQPSPLAAGPSDE